MEILEHLTKEMVKLNLITISESEAIKMSDDQVIQPVDVDQHLWHLELLALGLLMGAVMIGVQS